MNLKPIARVVTYDGRENKILLVRNKNASFWYAPGGHWEIDHENILECAKREMLEETGLHVDIERLIYAQEFHGMENVICLEIFWLAKLSHDQELNISHVDLDPYGEVEEVRWFKREDLQNLKVFPKRLQNTFWDNIGNLEKFEDPFIGIV
jgi:ADP-ribose pyrophosphatase YjhB (NUDIX family)